mmetsp:Transcript_85072/g.235720  ORF Transcript_85072/g.235720 Transcript_85072/m.235720 type:complete len:317 (+) Transcript_85072:58-1008(+)
MGTGGNDAWILPWIVGATAEGVGDPLPPSPCRGHGRKRSRLRGEPLQVPRQWVLGLQLGAARHRDSGSLGQGLRPLRTPQQLAGARQEPGCADVREGGQALRLCKHGFNLLYEARKATLAKAPEPLDLCFQPGAKGAVAKSRLARRNKEDDVRRVLKLHCLQQVGQRPRRNRAACTVAGDNEPQWLWNLQHREQHRIDVVRGCCEGTEEAFMGTRDPAAATVEEATLSHSKEALRCLHEWPKLCQPAGLNSMPFGIRCSAAICEDHVSFAVRDEPTCGHCASMAEAPVQAEPQALHKLLQRFLCLTRPTGHSFEGL